MSIRAEIRPSAPYDRTQAAINELSPEDREEVHDVLLNDPTYTYTDVAEYLNRKTSNKHGVDKSSVTNYRSKLLKGKVGT